MRQQGGITLSGGEPLDQFAFTSEVLRQAGARGWHRCLDTTGHAPAKRIKAALPLVDRWLLDWKAPNEMLHRRLTGVSQQPVKRSLALLEQAQAAVTLRCPMVPDVNDGDAALDAIAELIANHRCIDGIEIMPYHRHGVAKAAEINAHIYAAPSASGEQAASWRWQLGQRLATRRHDVTVN